MRRWRLDLDAARCYQQFLVPSMFQPWATGLVDRARLSPGCRVLDLACGTGAATRIAAERVGPGGEVVGIDLNVAMLSVARSPQPVPGARIHWQWGDAEDLPLFDLPFDAVLCHQGFQFFPDRVKAALEIARVLRQGGRLALSVWCGPDRNPLAAALIGVLQNRGHPELSRAMRWPFSVQNRREITAPIARAGFRVLTAELSRLRVCAVNATAFIHGFLRAMPFAGEIHGRRWKHWSAIPFLLLEITSIKTNCGCRRKLTSSSPSVRQSFFIKIDEERNRDKSGWSAVQSRTPTRPVFFTVVG